MSSLDPPTDDALPADLNRAKVDRPNSQVGPIKALDFSGHPIAPRERDDFVSHALGGKAHRRSEHSHEDDGRRGTQPIPGQRHTFGLAIVRPTTNVLPWNELFPPDSQR